DFQIKIRGFRIELEEIEARLREHPEVQEAVVMAREDGPGDKRLVAYYTRAKIGEQDEYPISVEALRAHLSASLPEYMAPAAYVPLEAMPLTPNGKLDRRALPKPELNGAGRVYVAPRTAMEEIVSGIWAEVLRIEKVGLTDNFFDMGGHSLLAMQLASRVRDILDVEITLRSLFTNPTVAVLASDLERLKRSEEKTPVPPLIRSDGAEDLPLSFAQQRLWFIEQMEPGNATYNIPCAVRL